MSNEKINKKTVSNEITVKIMNRSYRIKSPPNKLESLNKAVKYLDEKLQEIGNENKSINTDNLLIITALNVVHEYLVQKKQNIQYIEDMNQQIKDLEAKIFTVLEK